MKPQSAKAKGRNLQKHVVNCILRYFPTLLPDDCSSRSMGAAGEDILLSPAARKCLPISIECKSKAAFAVYKDYAQAQANSGVHVPVLVIKGNKQKPLAVVDLEHYFELWQKVNGREIQ